MSPPDSSMPSVVYERFDGAASVPLSPPMAHLSWSLWTQEPHGTPSIIGRADGSFVVVWSANIGTYEKFVQRYDAQGIALGKGP